MTVRKSAENLISGRYFEKNPCDTAFDFLPEPRPLYPDLFCHLDHAAEAGGATAAAPVSNTADRMID